MLREAMNTLADTPAIKEAKQKTPWACLSPPTPETGKVSATSNKSYGRSTRTQQLNHEKSSEDTGSDREGAVQQKMNIEIVQLEKKLTLLDMDQTTDNQPNYTKA
jgi:hypothetical protein